MQKKFFTILTGVALTVSLLGSASATNTSPEIANSQWFDMGEYITICEESQERMSKAHDLAEAARALDIEEDSDVICLAQSIWQEANDEQTKAQESINEFNFSYNFELFEPTGLSVDAFDQLLEDTGLEGCGQAFYDMEAEYGINGLFAMSVAKVESSLGESKRAKSINDCFGMLGTKYNSKYDNIMAFGKLMLGPQYKGKNINAIARIYCPPTASKWASDVMWCMRDFWNKLS